MNTAAEGQAVLIAMAARNRIAQVLVPVLGENFPWTKPCAGCHNISTIAPNNTLGGGIVFPRSAGFVHVSEASEIGPEGERFVVSPALSTVFLPHRKTVMEQFLSTP